MKKLIASSILFTSLIFPSISLAEEGNSPSKMGVDKKTAVRKGATVDYPIVQYINPGQTVSVIDQYTNKQGELWYRLDLGKNLLGWSLANSFYKQSFIGQTGNIKGTNVNVRRGAATSYESVAKLSNGKKRTIIGTYVNSKGENWLRVQFEEITGWVLQNFLDISSASNPPVVKPSPTFKTVQQPVVSVRRGALHTYDEVATLVQGQKVSIMGKHKNSAGENWARVDLGNNLLGWVLDTAFEAPVVTPPPSIEEKLIQVELAPVRKGATKNYPIVSHLKKGQKVSVIDNHKNSVGENWARVDLGNNLFGWILDTAFEAPVVTPPPSIEEKVIQVETTSVRKGATKDYPIVSNLKKGQKVSIVDKHKNSAGENWSRVDLGNNLFGWVLDTAFEAPVVTPPPPIEEKVIQVETTPVRKGATKDYPIVSHLKKGQKISVVDKHTNSAGENWSRVDLGNNLFGWVLNSAFELPEETTPVKEEENVIQVEFTPVRKGATKDYSIVLHLEKGQKVSVVDKHTNSTGEEWFRVDLGNNLLGWVINTAFDVSSTPVKIPGAPEIGKTVYSQENNVLVRKGAVHTYTSIANLKLNQQAEVLSHFIDSNGQPWLKLQVTPTIIGWVPANQVSVSKVVEPTQYIGTRNAVLRSGASFSNPVIESIAYNSKVTVSDTFTGKSGDVWYQIKTNNGTTGWIPEYELVLTVDQYQLVYAFDGALLRRGANASYERVVTLKANEPLIVLQSITNWLNVETQSGIRGWIEESSVSTLSTHRLKDPTTQIVNGEQLLTWEKSSDFEIAYEILTSNRIKLTGIYSDVELPSSSVTGLKSVELLQTNSFEKSVVITFQPGYTYTIRNYHDKLTIKILPTGLKGKKIIIDPGHGGKDPGAIGPSGLKEKEVNLGTALLLKEELENYGAIVQLTRSTDVFLELHERTYIANGSDGDAFISIHADSFNSTANGTTTLYNTTVNFNGPLSATLAKDIQENLVSSLSTYNRGVKDQNLYVNRMNELPSILVELAFISNPNEEALLASKSFRQKAVTGIRNGLEEFFSN